MHVHRAVTGGLHGELIKTSVLFAYCLISPAAAAAHELLYTLTTVGSQSQEICSLQVSSAEDNPCACTDS